MDILRLAEEAAFAAKPVVYAFLPAPTANYHVR